MLRSISISTCMFKNDWPPKKVHVVGTLENVFPPNKIYCSTRVHQIFSQPVFSLLPGATTKSKARSIKTWGVFEVCMSNFCPSKPPCVFFKHMFKTARLVLTGCDFFFLGGLGKGWFFVEFCVEVFLGGCGSELTCIPPSDFGVFCLAPQKWILESHIIPSVRWSPGLEKVFQHPKYPINKKSGVLSRCSSVQKPISLDPQRVKPNVSKMMEAPHRVLLGDGFWGEWSPIRSYF